MKPEKMLHQGRGRGNRKLKRQAKRAIKERYHKTDFPNLKLLFPNVRFVLCLYGFYAVSGSRGTFGKTKLVAMLRYIESGS